MSDGERNKLVRRPNVFIVGAPKSGTTSLYYYLGQHPDVFASSFKEPCYLAPEFHSPGYPQSLEEYLAGFAAATNERYVAEATTTYLFSRQAAAEIKKFAPRAKIIIMLRNPIDMIYSLHSQRVFELAEDIVDFETALSAEEDRRHGKRLPKTLIGPKEYLLYRDFGMYSDQVKRFLDTFDKGDVFVIVFDDFRANPRGQFRAVCEFLDIDPDVEVDLSVKRPNVRVRSLWLKRILVSFPESLRRVGRLLPSGLRQWIRRRILSANLTVEARPPMSAELRERLKRQFAPDAASLSGLLGRDLSHWVVAEGQPCQRTAGKDGNGIR